MMRAEYKVLRNLLMFKKIICRRFSTNIVIPQKDSRVFGISQEIRDAIHSKQPVVALESTIYTHVRQFKDSLEALPYKYRVFHIRII